MLQKCKVIHFPNLDDGRGNLIVIESGQAVPFEIKRLFYIYGASNDAIRGQHANRESEFVLINVAGKSKVRIMDGDNEVIFNLDTPNKGVYIPKMLWKEMYDFSEDSVLLVLANTNYNSQEYIRDYEHYRKLVESIRNGE